MIQSIFAIHGAGQALLLGGSVEGTDVPIRYEVP